MVNKNNKNTNRSSSSKKTKKNYNSKSKHTNTNTNKKDYKLKNKKGGGLNDTYQNDEYKDTGFLDSLKFESRDALSQRTISDIPSPPSCTIL